MKELNSGNFSWWEEIQPETIIMIEAIFLLTEQDIKEAMDSDHIIFNGRKCKVPYQQLRNAKPGAVKLTLQQID